MNADTCINCGLTPGRQHEREALAAAIIDHQIPQQNALTKPEDALTMVRADPNFHVCRKALDLADALLAAGWTRTPRPVTVSECSGAGDCSARAALPHLTTGQSEVEHELSHRREDSSLAREAMERLSVVQAERDEALAVIERVRELARDAPLVPIHAGGGNSVDRQRMVHAESIRALLPDTPNDERSTT